MHASFDVTMFTSTPWKRKMHLHLNILIMLLVLVSVEYLHFSSLFEFISLPLFCMLIQAFVPLGYSYRCDSASVGKSIVGVVLAV